MYRVSIFCVLLCIIASFTSPDWGFYGHRKINRMAVFTLPPEMISYFKNHIEYLTEHAVDPDKRRYATKFEAVRHYIDIDHWDVAPFDKVPRKWHEAFLSYAKILHIKNEDTLIYKWPCSFLEEDYDTLAMSCDSSYSFYYNLIHDKYYDDNIVLSVEDVNAYFPQGESMFKRGEIHIEDTFSDYGVLPYHLAQYYQKLVQAFIDRNSKSILRLCAEMGHYIGDAHVPLHTTENYNGQMSNQIGIHGFWESRLPELFADESYDFFVGKAEYVEDVKPYFWDVVLASHSYLPEVFDIERQLSQSYPQDQQYCFEERLERTIQTQCTDYAAAYHGELDGMVELRMRQAIQSIGSIWYSAWIDAGQPDLQSLDSPLPGEIQKEEEELNKSFNNGNIRGRQHDN